MLCPLKFGLLTETSCDEAQCQWWNKEEEICYFPTLHYDICAVHIELKKIGDCMREIANASHATVDQLKEIHDQKLTHIAGALYEISNAIDRSV